MVLTMEEKLIDWVNNNICFIDDENYWSCIADIAFSGMGFGDRFTEKVEQELKMYLEAQNDHLLSNETINFVKNVAYKVFLQYQ
jgi:hypothetical protein